MTNTTRQSNSEKIPKLRFPGFSGRWEENKLANITNIYDGTHQTPNYVKQGIPFYSVEHVTANDFSDTKYVTRDVFEKENRKVKLEKKDILMTRIGDIGTARLIDWDVNASFYVSLALIKQSKKIDPLFLSKYINSSNFQRELWKRSIHVAFPKKINLGEIGECKLSIPSDPEQQKIAEFLESTDKWIENLKEQKESFESYKKGIMQKLFSQEIRFKDNKGKEFSKWGEKKLGEIIDFLSDYTANGSFASLKDNVQYYSTKNYAVLVRTTDLEKEKFEPQRFTDKKGYDFLKKTSLFGGELILANVGNTGKVYKVPKYDGYMTLAPNTYVIKFKEFMNQEFVYQWMLTVEFINKIASVVGGSGLKAINKVTLRSILISVPNIDEQQKIAEFLTSIDKVIESKQQQITQAELWKKGLMQGLFV